MTAPTSGSDATVVLAPTLTHTCTHVCAPNTLAHCRAYVHAQPHAVPLHTHTHTTLTHLLKFSDIYLVIRGTGMQNMHIHKLVPTCPRKSHLHEHVHQQALTIHRCTHQTPCTSPPSSRPLFDALVSPVSLCSHTTHLKRGGGREGARLGAEGAACGQWSGKGLDTQPRSGSGERGEWG